MGKYPLLILSVLFLLIACESNEPGGIRLHYSWVDSEGNDITPPDLSLLFAWGELKYGSETKATEAVWMGDDDATLHFSGLPYGVSMTMTITMRLANTTGNDSDIIGAEDEPEARPDNVAYYCTSQEFSLARGKVTDVNNACVMQKGPALSDENKPGAPVLTLSYTDDTDSETPIDAATEFKTPTKTVSIAFTVPNDNFDTVIVANDTGFALGRKEYPKPKKGSDGKYRLSAHDLDDGLPLTGDGSRIVALKLRNAVGFESLPGTKTLFLDTTAPFLTVKSDATAYNGAGTMTATLSSNETLKGAPTVGLYDEDDTLVIDLTAEAEELQPGTSYRYQVAVHGNLTDGSYHLKATGIDIVDNGAEPILSDPFTVDSIAPELDGDPIIDPIRVKAEQTYEVTFTTKDDLTGGTVTVTRKEETLTCTNEGNDYTCTGTAPTGDKDTVDPVIITLTDPAGNFASFNAGNLTIDRTAPLITIDLNKSDFNAADTIRITVNSSEELTGDPTVTIPAAPMTLSSPVKISTLSWLYLLDPGLLDDGDYTVNATGSDLVALGGSKSADFSVDSSIPAVSGTASISPVRVKPGDKAKITFTATEPMNDTNDTVTVKVGETTASCTSDDGLVYACTYTASGTGDDSIETISIALADASANGTTTPGGTIYVDRTPPNIAIDLNKTAFNSSDTIRAIVTASEELNGEPVVTIPAASMTISSPTQISGFSWLYTLDPTLLSDDDYTIAASAIDKVEWGGTDSADFSVDSSIPDLVTGSVDRSKAGIGITYTVDFEITEPVVGGVPMVKANTITLTDCAQNGSDTIFRCTRTVGSEESDSTVYAISALLADAAGNSRTVTIGSVMADKVLPGTVADTAVLSIDAGANCALTQEQVTTLAAGSVAYLSVQVSEKLEDGYTPTLTATKTGAPARAFDLDAQSGLTYYFSYPYSEAIPTAEMIGEYTLELALRDEAGNETVATVTPDKPFKTAWNTPVLVVNQNAVSYNRSPWGRPTPTELKDGGNNLIYTIPAGDYYELGPNDIYEAVDRLPANTFTLDYGTAVGTPMLLKAWNKNGAETQMVHNTPDIDGTWPRGRIWSYNSSEISLSAIDSSCLETGKIGILNNTWIATMNDKLPGDDYLNQNSFYSIENKEESLKQHPDYIKETLYAGISMTIQSGTPTWSEWTGYLTWPSARAHHAMAYDCVRGKVVLLGGLGSGNRPNNETWEWDGTSWIRQYSLYSILELHAHAMAYDSARGESVVLGGYNAISDYMWLWNGSDWNWKELDYYTNPSLRHDHAMAYDSTRGKVVLFGGYDYSKTCSDGSSSSCQDTWEWDGMNWTQMNPATKPVARSEHSMVYDSARGNIVLFGGITYGESFPVANNETWLWDGTNWTQMNPTSQPTKRTGHSMAYDSAREKVVLFGGSSGGDETWEWDGTNWTQRNPTIKPLSRRYHTMVYDSARGKVVLFGGLYGESSYLSDTWEWDGLNWKHIKSTAKPTERSEHAMIYDNTLEKTFLFGGAVTSYNSWGTKTKVNNNETWEKDSIGWNILNPTNSPTARSGHRMIYMNISGKTLLFGGQTGTATYNDETWEWIGANWIQLNPANKPSARSEHAATYDMSRHKVVLFGGRNASRNNETWEWDGDNWTQMNPVESPSPRSGHAMVYESFRGKVLLFGGQVGISTYSDETWEWDGTNWTLLNPENKPSARSGHTIYYDHTVGKTFLFGGYAGSDYNNETWEWDGNNWTQMNPAINPPELYSHAMAYDNLNGKVILFGGIKSSDYESDETWLWSGNGNDRPGQIMNIAFESSGVTDDATVAYQSLSVFFNAGGLGDITGTPTNGVDLLTWKHDRWVKVSSNGAGPDDLAPVTWETTDPVEIQTLLNSGLRKFNFAVVPTAPNGFLTDMGSIATDYAEVVVRYRIP